MNADAMDGEVERVWTVAGIAGDQLPPRRQCLACLRCRERNDRAGALTLR